MYKCQDDVSFTFWGKPQTLFEQTKPALPALKRLLHSNDDEVLIDACWALSYLSDGTNDKIQAVIEACICPRLVELLLHPSPSVLVPALRTVGNIVTGDDMQTQALPCLLNLSTENYKKSIKKEACWTISNITAGNVNQIQCDLLNRPDPRIVTVCLEGLENILKVGEAEKNAGNTGDVNVFAQVIAEAEGLEKIENPQSHDNNEIYEKVVKILETLGGGG
ncbi:importin subunit alpha-like [Mangifera indica]|uniref:importin subunit alpha-like n=1 Tax=Mangifera indica TaxID=29780 RepID=UPI001CFAE025|nr:importin subunit alpha-like [Mangifera indica]XP_044502472.1 importin subunit alpha-like [Mangifera indica]